MTIKNVYDHYVKSLAFLYEKSEAQRISQWVIEDILGINKTQIFLRSEEKVSELKANNLAWKLMRLMKGEPVQYVTGYAYFYGLKIRVNKSVLIPRPETEELVEWIISEEKNRNELSVLDIGTGSGCIAIALKKNLPLAKVYGMDISGKALLVAGENAEVNNTEVSFVNEDILHFRSKLARPAFNIIVSNPPYIPQKEQSSLHKNVLSFEPHEALFVPDDDPLLFYK
ncbi:MAG: peptide chain release factor N(5)-glutamine methyltransferase, partial [Chitinophagales bacterium]